MAPWTWRAPAATAARELATPQRWIVRSGHATEPRHPERRELGLLDGQALEIPEDLGVLGVLPQEGGVDETLPQAVARVGHAQLRLVRQRHALALHAVTQGRV